MVLAIFLVGCSTENISNIKEGVAENLEDELNNKEIGSTIEENFDKISDAVNSGKSVKCTIKMTDEDISIDGIYWIKNDNFRTEITTNGVTQIFIIKEGISYIQTDMSIIESDCDWMSVSY